MKPNKRRLLFEIVFNVGVKFKLFLISRFVGNAAQDRPTDRTKDKMKWKTFFHLPSWHFLQFYFHTRAEIFPSIPKFIASSIYTFLIYIPEVLVILASNVIQFSWIANYQFVWAVHVIKRCLPFNSHLRERWLDETNLTTVFV